MTAIEKKPTYDNEFSIDLLRAYLDQLVRQGYLDDPGESPTVDFSAAVEALLYHCYRLKEPLFLLAVIENKYNELIKLVEHSRDNSPQSVRTRANEVLNEWADLHVLLRDKELSDETMNSILPYRYARMSQAAKSWKFRTSLIAWQKKYGHLRDEGDMTEEERRCARRYRGKTYRYTYRSPEQMPSYRMRQKQEKLLEPEDNSS